MTMAAGLRFLEFREFRVGPQQVIDNSRKELKMGPILVPKTVFLGLKSAL
jgi:hypothetical protein